MPALHSGEWINTAHEDWPVHGEPEEGDYVEIVVYDDDDYRKECGTVVTEVTTKYNSTRFGRLYDMKVLCCSEPTFRRWINSTGCKTIWLEDGYNYLDIRVRFCGLKMG